MNNRKYNTENLTSWKKGQSGNPNGQPRKLISDTINQLEAMGIEETNKREIVSIFLRLVNTQHRELEVLESDEEQSALVRIISRAIISGKGFEIIEKLLDRGIGKPTERAEIVSKTKELHYTTEERNRKIKELIEKGKLN